MHHNGSQISREYHSSAFLKEPPCLLISGWSRTVSWESGLQSLISAVIVVNSAAYNFHLVELFIYLSYCFSLCGVEFYWSKMCPVHAVILLYICSFISLINQGQSAGPSEMKNSEASFKWDSRGYVFYCPCRGKWIFRCGNYYVYPPFMCIFSIPSFENFLWYWQGEFNSPEFLVLSLRSCWVNFPSFAAWGLSPRTR